MDYRINGNYFETNKRLWEKRTHVHIGSEFYETDAIVAGKSSLTEIEESLLPDLHGKRVLHLQCHFGLDTISLARRGAICTGLDFSKEAIRNAKELSEKAGLP
jgi:2-polyprenyl-3-methyl-5-hydroxy-6-metoxy-1,4-benzoquinol methylase